MPQSSTPAVIAGVEVLGLDQVAEAFGRARKTVEGWQRHKDMPGPDVKIGRSPGWFRPGPLFTWGRQTGRLDEHGEPIAPNART